MRSICHPISLFICSRNRYSLLTTTVLSIKERAKDQNNYELILLIDDDDKDIENIVSFMRAVELKNYRLIIRPRQALFQMGLSNYGAQVARGKYIWSINDECEVLTDLWDEYIIKTCDAYLADKPDGLLYYGMDDDTHTRIKVNEIVGSCFPLLTAEAIDVLECLIPNELGKAGADTELYKIFLALRDIYGIDRIVWDLNLRVNHRSGGNGYREYDETQYNYPQGRSQLFPNELEMYTNKLVNHVKK